MKGSRVSHYVVLIGFLVSLALWGNVTSSGLAHARTTSAACNGMTNIRIGISPFQDTLLPSVGQQLGWYKQNCLNVSLVNVSWDAMMTTMASRSIDVAVYNTTGVVSTHHIASNLVFAYPWDIFDQGAAMMGRPGRGLKTFAQFRARGLSAQAARTATMRQLKGRTVVTTLGTDMGEDLVMALHRTGMSLSDVKVINLSTDQGLAAFLRGTGDAYIGGIPQRTRLVTDHYLTLLAGPDLTAPPINGFVTTRAFATQNRDALLRLIHVTYMIIRYTQAHTRLVGAFITSTLNKQTAAGMKPSDFVSFWQHWEHYPLNAAQAQRELFNPNGFGFWQRTWNQDNTYLVNFSHVLKVKVPTSVFLGVQMQRAYVSKYGANERGWDKPTGSL